MNRLMTQDGWLDWERKGDDIIFCAYGDRANKARIDFNKIIDKWKSQGYKSANVIEETLSNAQNFMLKI